jgi:hypothetical protein
MSGADRERTRWFLRNILPHEPALRGWLSRAAPGGIDPDDIIQEAYTILAELETVEGIRYPRAYLFQVARSVIMRHVRRARIVPIHTVDDLERLEASRRRGLARAARDRSRRTAATGPRDRGHAAQDPRGFHPSPCRGLATARDRRADADIREYGRDAYFTRHPFLIDWFGRSGNRRSQTSRTDGIGDCRDRWPSEKPVETLIRRRPNGRRDWIVGR